MNTRALMLIVFLVITISLTGCFSANPKDLEAFLRPSEADVTADNYILEPPDEIMVISSKVPELQGISGAGGFTGGGSTLGYTQTIRPDGYISFENFGEIYVAGKTPRQVAKIIGEKASKLYNLTGDYPVDVRVNQYLSKFYYVLGQVSNPGAKIFTGRETTLSALGKAVPKTLAWKEQVQVIRPSADPTAKPKIFRLDYRRMIERGEMKHNVLLQEGDIIYVPPTILASIGLTIQELFGPIFQGAGVVNIISPTTP